MPGDSENPRTPVKAQPAPKAQGSQQKTAGKSMQHTQRKQQKEVLDNMGIDDVEQGIIQGLLDESATKAERKRKMDQKIDKFLRSDAGEYKERQAREDLWAVLLC